MEKYNKVIKDQLEQGIVERADGNPTRREFYITHKLVVRDSAESTKLKVVYDTSTHDKGSSPSLNECLNPGPPLQNQLWNVLVRAQFHLVLTSRIYVPLGLIAPMTLTGKLLYRDACNAKLAWDAKLPDELFQRLTKWEKGLSTNVSGARGYGLAR